MKSENHYKFVFGDKPLTLTADKDNLLIEEVERVVREKYNTIKEKLLQIDNETIIVLMVINSFFTQPSRGIEVGKMEKELAAPRSGAVADIKEEVNEPDSGGD